jgi:hypothetical protein
MIFFPGALLIGCVLALALTPAGPGKLKGYEVLGTCLLMLFTVVSSLIWSDRGYAVSWDNHSVYLREYGGRFLFRRHPFAGIALRDIRGIKFLPPPRGVPPKYPLLQIDARSHTEGPPLFVDPNYFKASSLTVFINELRRRLPQLSDGKQSKAIDCLLKRLGS